MTSAPSTSANPSIDCPRVFRRRVVTVLTAVLTACLSALAAVAPAQAAGDRVGDGRNDVFVYDWITDDGDTGWWDPDIASTRISHTTRRVTSVTTFHRLSRYPWDYFTVLIDADRDNAVDYRMEIGEGNGVYRGRFGFRRLCHISSRVNLRRDIVRLSAPRGCFDRPRALRAKVEFWSSWGPDCCEDWANDATRWTRNVRRG